MIDRLAGIWIMKIHLNPMIKPATLKSIRLSCNPIDHEVKLVTAMNK